MPSSVRSLLVTLAALTLGARLEAQQTRVLPDAATSATIRHLLDLTGAGTLALRSMEALVPAQRAANPRIPAAFWDAFLARARRQIPDLVDSLIPIYASHYSRPELDALVGFYESPLGRHVAAVQPAIMEESVQTGRRWGEAMGRNIADSLARAGATVGSPK